jgi:hypothetical protein
MAEGISLGWNCTSAIKGVAMGLRSIKANGYKTCPFDEMITNYRGIIECIKDDFEPLCDPQYLELMKIPKESKLLNTNGDGDTVIYHTKYKFIFNHESPGHANLFAKQKWAKGINHFTANNYEEFIIRYQRRIANIKELLNSNKKITFILTRPDTVLEDIGELRDVITKKYPRLRFEVVLLKLNFKDRRFFLASLLLMKIDKNDDEIKRLNF